MPSSLKDECDDVVTYDVVEPWGEYDIAVSFIVAQKRYSHSPSRP